MQGGLHTHLRHRQIGDLNIAARLDAVRFVENETGPADVGGSAKLARKGRIEAGAGEKACMGEADTQRGELKAVPLIEKCQGSASVSAVMPPARGRHQCLASAHAAARAASRLRRFW